MMGVTTISDSIASNAMLSSLKATTNTTASLMAALIPSAVAGSVAGPSIKPKVSFRDRIKSLQHSDTKQTPFQATVTAPTTLTTCNEKEHKTTADDKEKLIENVPSTPVGSAASGGASGNGNGKSTKTSVGTMSFKEKIKQLSQQHVTRSEDSGVAQLKPWSKLKLATVLSGGSSYASLNNSFAESSPIHIHQHVQQQQGKQQLFPQQQPIKVAKIRPTTSSRGMSSSATSIATAPKKYDKTSISSSIPKLKTAQTSNRLKVKYNERICTSDSEIRHTEWQLNGKSRLKSRTQGETKIYRSVDDLSPEYGGLPFVKKLKILNERQKLAELESAMKTRSFSLDCPEWSDGNEPEPLIRSSSEGSGLTRSKIATISMVAPTSYLNTSNQIVPIAPLNVPRTPISPEANETQERRELKSILKKLSEEKDQLPKLKAATEPEELKGLLSAPTVEGYVARHSKFMKSVTFYSTLSSPPTSAHSAISERSSFPLLSGAQSPNETPTSTTAALIQVDDPEQQQHQYTQSDQSFLLLPDSINSKALQEGGTTVDDMMLLTQQEHRTTSLSPQQQMQTQAQTHFPFDGDLQKIDETSPLNGSTNPFISNKIKVKGK